MYPTITPTKGPAWKADGWEGDAHAIERDGDARGDGWDGDGHEKNASKRVASTRRIPFVESSALLLARFLRARSRHAHLVPVSFALLCRIFRLCRRLPDPGR